MKSFAASSLLCLVFGSSSLALPGTEARVRSYQPAPTVVHVGHRDLGAESASYLDGRPFDAQSRSIDAQQEVTKAFSGMPLCFVENRGQINSLAQYYLQGQRSTVFFTATGLIHSLSIRPGEKRSVLELDFVGARASLRPVARDETDTLFSYFKGPSSQWKAGLRTYRELAYEEVWPGIDLVYAASGAKLKYEFHVKAGADPASIRMAFRGASGARIDNTGRLIVSTDGGEITDERPFCYQENQGQRQTVASEYLLAKTTRGAFEYSFRIGEFDRSRVLVIDPAQLIYAGYIGGSEGENITSLAVDGEGNTYVAGVTGSSEATFPNGDGFGSLTGWDTSYNGFEVAIGDVFVAKVNSAGDDLEYATYIGGSGDDYDPAIAVDSFGNVYVAGSTSTSNGTFPVVTGPDLTYNGTSTSNLRGDAFVAKLDSTGTALLYSGYIGGSGGDTTTGIAIDAQGHAYVTGYTDSTQTTFPDGDGFGAITGPDTTFNGGGNGFGDAFVAKVNPSGSALVYAGYIGGSGDDGGFGIAVDGDFNAYVVGRASSKQTTFPDGDGFGTVSGPDVTFNVGSEFDAFIAKVNATGTALVYAGYIGGSGNDAASGVALDAGGSAYVVGGTQSSESTFPDGDGFGALSGPDVTFNGGGDGFVVKVNPSGSALVYAGYIGGLEGDDGGDGCYGVALDHAGRVFVGGATGATQETFPDGDGFGTVTGPDVTYNGGPNDGYVVGIDPAGTSFIYATYIGGGSVDAAASIAIDLAGNLYVAGTAVSTEATFPDGDGFGMLTSPDTTHNGVSDGFLAKLAPPGSEDSAGVYISLSGAWFLKNVNEAGGADLVFTFGAGGSGVVAVRGDWNGDGVDTPGLYVIATGVYFLRHMNSPGPADVVLTFGAGGAGIVPIVGDWNGDGMDTIGIYAQTTGAFFLRNNNSPGPADSVFSFGAGGSGVLPVVGDWNDDGTDTVGLYVQGSGVFFLKNANTSGGADITLGYGPTGLQWQPLSGDFDGDGDDTIGLYDPGSGVFFLRNENQPGPADLVFGYGPTDVTPLTGDWDGS